MTKLPAPNIDARYVITLADLQQLKKAQLIAGLALEPKPGYKPASREIMATALKCCVDVIDNLNLDDYIPAMKMTGSKMKEIMELSWCYKDPAKGELERKVIAAAEKVADWSRKSTDFAGPSDALNDLCELGDAVDLYRAGEPDGTGADPQNLTDSLNPEPTGFNSLPGLSGSSQTVAHSILTETPDVH